MNVQLSVRTADKVPIVGATVSVEGASPVTTDQNGQVSLSPSGNSFTVTASMVNYNEQAVTIIVGTSGTVSWDDPGTIVTRVDQQLNVEIRMGRLVPAPTVPFDANILKIPDSVFKTFKTPQNPSYVVPLQNTFTVPDGEYAFVFAGKLNFWAITGPTVIGDPNAPGWGAFAAKPTLREPRMQGRFVWVEWAPPGGSPSSLNRYLLGLWRPRSSVVSGSVSRDAIIFYTPNTSATRNYLPDTPPYRRNYPYALNQGDQDPQTLAQRYVGLGHRYLFNEKFLTYQMLAAARDALLIVPIQPAAQWGIFQTPTATERLLSEALLFDHRQRLIPDAGSDILDTAPERNDRGGLFVRTRLAQYLPPPGLGTVVTAGFSAGMQVVKQLMNASGGASGASTRSWQNETQDSYSADPTEFIASWREIWDLDGSENAIGTPGVWIKTLADWQRASGHYASGHSDRTARCYHTDYTGWSANNLSATSPFVGDPVPGTAAPSQNTKVAERHGASGSAVWISHTYLTGNGPPANWKTPDGSQDPPNAPAFWTGVEPPGDVGANGHQAVPMICLAHAAGQSQLRKL